MTSGDSCISVLINIFYREKQCFRTSQRRTNSYRSVRGEINHQREKSWTLWQHPRDFYSLFNGVNDQPFSEFWVPWPSPLINRIKSSNVLAFFSLKHWLDSEQFRRSRAGCVNSSMSICLPVGCFSALFLQRTTSDMAKIGETPDL